MQNVFGQNVIISGQVTNVAKLVDESLVQPDNNITKLRTNSHIMMISILRNWWSNSYFKNISGYQSDVASEFKLIASAYPFSTCN